MLSSLRHRLFIGFGLVILLTVGLSGLVSSITTTNRFNILITEQGNQRAFEIAPLLEASYTFHGNWNGVINLLQTSSDEVATDDFFEDWVSDVDWYEIVADAVALNLETFFTELESVNSIAALIEERNVDPEQVRLAILEAEQDAVETAVAEQELSEEAGEQYLALTEDEIDWFLNEPFNVPLTESEIALFDGNIEDLAQDFVDWDAIIQQQLSLTETAFFELTETQSIADIAQARNVPLAQIEQAIVQAEMAYLDQEFFYNDIDYMLVLADTVTWVRSYLVEDYTDFEPNNAQPPYGSGILASYLLGDEQLFIGSG